MTEVVITRKHKKLHRGWHLLAFMLTGGATAPVTAAKAATNALYNAETRKIAERTGATVVPPKRGKREKITWTEEERAYLAAHVPTR